MRAIHCYFRFAREIGKDVVFLLEIYEYSILSDTLLPHKCVLFFRFQLILYHFVHKIYYSF